MRPLEEARAEVLAAIAPLGAERVGLDHAGGRILAETVTARHDVPPFANSAMDGFAILSSDLESVPTTLEILEDVPAGSVATQAVRLGTAIKIMTGAPMPGGADAVAKVEITEQPDPRHVRILEKVPPGTAIRPPGGDVRSGEVVLEPGRLIGPPEIALLATVGAAHPEVGCRPRVAVMATGDELVAADTSELGPGQIRDSNRWMIACLVEDAGGTVLDMGVVGDTESELTSALSEAASAADAIITSGGVSMGEYDLIKKVLSRRGDVGFWKVAMQPAKPFAFGKLSGTPLFGLPGNPVSSLIAFEQFARPALLKMQGATTLGRPRINAITGEAFSTDPEKTVFLRVALRKVDGRLIATQSGSQGSHVMSAVAAADGFAVIPRGISEVGEGNPVEVELFRHPVREGLT